MFRLSFKSLCKNVQQFSTNNHILQPHNHPGVRFPKASLANYGRKFRRYLHNESVFPETIVPTDIRKQHRKVGWFERQLSTCG